MEIPRTVPQTQRHSRLKTVPPVPEYGPDNPRRKGHLNPAKDIVFDA